MEEDRRTEHERIRSLDDISPINVLLERLYQEGELTKEDTVFVLSNLDAPARKLLFTLADRRRRDYYGNRVYLRGLIEFSNYCRQNCLYCGIRSSNRKVQRYRLSDNQILQCSAEGYSLGYRTFVLQSGEDPYYTEERLIRLVHEIKSSFPEAALTLSIGERDRRTFQKLYEAGADRYLMRHETASRHLYDRLHPTMTFQNRRECLQTLQDIGYQIGAGFMVGLPGQTVSDLAEDLLYVKSLHPDMIGIGPFLPHRDTPLCDETPGTVEDTLVMVALARLFVPDSLIPATTAMGTVHPRGREMALEAGANVVMPNLSPVAVRNQYELYNNKICMGEESAQCKACLEIRIAAAGFQAAPGRGDSIKAIRKRGAS